MTSHAALLTQCPHGSVHVLPYQPSLHSVRTQTRSGVSHTKSHVGSGNVRTKRTDWMNATVISHTNSQVGSDNVKTKRTDWMNATVISHTKLLLLVAFT